MFQFFKHKKSKEGGFTLVELLVSIGLFVVVLTFSLGSVISVLDAGRKARSIQAVMTNLNFTLEIMSREIKFGTKYHCFVPAEPLVLSAGFTTQDCTGGANPPGAAIGFMSNDGLTTIYNWDNNPASPTYHQILKSTDGGTSFTGVTAPEVVITSLKYYVFGSAPGPADKAQPRVIMVISGYAGSKPSSQTNFTVETTVSQRKLDL